MSNCQVWQPNSLKPLLKSSTAKIANRIVGSRRNWIWKIAYKIIENFRTEIRWSPLEKATACSTSADLNQIVDIAWKISSPSLRRQITMLQRSLKWFLLGAGTISPRFLPFPSFSLQFFPERYDRILATGKA